MSAKSNPSLDRLAPFSSTPITGRAGRLHPMKAKFCLLGQPTTKGSIEHLFRSLDDWEPVQLSRSLVACDDNDGGTALSWALRVWKSANGQR
ncbi:Hypothetical protein NGAL_HAMBI2605_18240 [Neorhizobium galegae bv. orientalis]|nr:Hypothetical protein NGAL_HAMBI2605_18240 [Neorhizobium galegae bv. orientalis]